MFRTTKGTLTIHIMVPSLWWSGGDPSDILSAEWVSECGAWAGGVGNSTSYGGCAHSWVHPHLPDWELGGRGPASDCSQGFWPVLTFNLKPASSQAVWGRDICFVSVLKFPLHHGSVPLQNAVRMKKIKKKKETKYKPKSCTTGSKHVKLLS